METMKMKFKAAYREARKYGVHREYESQKVKKAVFLAIFAERISLEKGRTYSIGGGEITAQYCGDTKRYCVQFKTWTSFAANATEAIADLKEARTNNPEDKMLISSQRYINDEIVAEKIANQDFEVQVSPEFEIDGMLVRVVLNGHHSLAAAKQAGIDPVFCEQDASENDMVGLIEQGRIDDFMAIARIDSDYYDVTTGVDVW